MVNGILVFISCKNSSYVCYMYWSFSLYKLISQKNIKYLSSTVWNKKKIALTFKIFREINSLLTSWIRENIAFTKKYQISKQHCTVWNKKNCSDFWNISWNQFFTNIGNFLNKGKRCFHEIFVKSVSEYSGMVNEKFTLTEKTFVKLTI